MNTDCGLRSLEGLSNQLFAFIPERLRILRIQCIATNTFTDGHIVRYDLGHVAVLAVLTADLLVRRDDTCPNRGCRTLRDCLELEGTMTFSRKLLAYLINHSL